MREARTSGLSQELKPPVPKQNEGGVERSRFAGVGVDWKALGKSLIPALEAADQAGRA